MGDALGGCVSLPIAECEESAGNIDAF